MSAMERVNALLREVSLPRMVQVRQKFNRESLTQVEKAVRKELDRPEIQGTIRPGMRVAVAAGSRGIRH